ncbi:MAG TPA: hypothetical protein ENH85_02635 [Candidatus Scalindua sp.]|nr:hypothetical protein [Candidatus Scalindua sp.]
MGLESAGFFVAVINFFKGVAYAIANYFRRQHERAERDRTDKEELEDSYKTGNASKRYSVLDRIRRRKSK